MNEHPSGQRAAKRAGAQASGFVDGAVTGDFGRTKGPLFRAAVVIGLGLGGFIDGIVLHQMLGWHHLICTTETCQPNSIEDLKVQASADGWFHLGTWAITVIGIALLVRTTAGRSTASMAPGRTVLGGAVAGWGIFNFVEGLIDHQILAIHHVRPQSSQWLIWDLLFLASGVVLAAGGWLIATRRSASRAV